MDLCWLSMFSRFRLDSDETNRLAAAGSSQLCGVRVRRCFIALAAGCSPRHSAGPSGKWRSDRAEASFAKRYARYCDDRRALQLGANKIMGGRVMGGRAVRLSWLAFLVAPPAVASVLLRQQVAAHPSTAVLVIAVYEAAAMAAGFISGVAGDLAARWRARLVERIDRSLTRVFSRFGSRYRSLVLADLQFIDEKGLRYVGPFTPRLDEVFVDVSLSSQAPHQISAGVLSDLSTDGPERRALSDFLDREKPVTLAVIGAPGSGKTTLLRNTARLACATRGRRRKYPLLIYLRDLVAEVTGTGMPDLAGAALTTLGDRTAHPPAGWFDKRLAAGDCVVLLDGLDEVADSDNRRKVSAWVESQIKRYPKNDYVITARPLGYQAAPVSGALVLQVLGFTSEQVSQFVRRWYLAAERFSSGDDSPQTRRRAEAGAADLLDRLSKAPALYELTTNPLLLTMIANVHKYRGQLPGSRAELYGEICQVLLWRRQEAKQLPTGPGAAREAVLRTLAYDMMCEQHRDLKRPDVLERFGKVLQRMAGMQTAEEFLADVSSSGLLVEREPGLYCFAHHTLQEYLAAAHIHDKGSVHTLIAAVDDDWWREATLLYVASADADPIVKACLASGGVTALALAFGCAQEARDLDPSFRQQLDDLLTEARAPGTDPERRRLLTGVLLIRHLDRQVTTQSGGRICPYPISQSLYWLFVQDAWEAHLPVGPPVDESSDAPVVGMNAIDARAFIRWQNSVIGTEEAYRLPTLAEISDKPAHRLLLPTALDPVGKCAWIESDSGTIELWIPPGASDPRLISAQAMVEDVQKDIARASRDLTKLLLLYAAVITRVLVHKKSAADTAALTKDLVRVLLRARALIVADTQGKASAMDPLVDTARALVRRGGDVTIKGADDLRRLDSAISRMRAVGEDGPFWRLVRPPSSFSVAGDLQQDLVQVMGSALSEALRSALDAEGVPAFRRVFTTGFSVVTGLRARTTPGKAWAFALESEISSASPASPLADAVKIYDARAAAAAMTGASEWARDAAQRLLLASAPAPGRAEGAPLETLRACRLTALCLAAELRPGDPQASFAFFSIAAMLSLSERRASGKAPATETILLARA
jgi:NACHT domain